jgi:hypothetical protein
VSGTEGKNLTRRFENLGVLAWLCELALDRRDQLAAKYPVLLQELLVNAVDPAGVTLDLMLSATRDAHGIEQFFRKVPAASHWWSRNIFCNTTV